MIVMVTGQYGSGKTTFMTREAVMRRLTIRAKFLEEEMGLEEDQLGRDRMKSEYPSLFAYAEWLEGIPSKREDEIPTIISTYPLKGIKHIYVTIPELVVLLKGEDEGESTLANSIFLMDEAHVWLDARRSTTKLSLFLNNQFIDWVRKFNISLYVTTQQWEKVDRRVTSGASIHVTCSFYKPNSKETLVFKDLLSGRKKKLSFIASQIFPFFDTAARVRGEGKLYRMGKGYLED